MPPKKRSPQPISMMQYVERVVDDVHNGNLMNASYSILALPKKQAVVVTAYVMDQVRDSHNYSALLRVLESHFDD